VQDCFKASYNLWLSVIRPVTASFTWKVPVNLISRNVVTYIVENTTTVIRFWRTEDPIFC